ncbi:DUF4091 domain-containing protein [bacterium]|nr:DUF4091 domain-containing protein [bacterium]
MFTERIMKFVGKFLLVSFLLVSASVSSLWAGEFRQSTDEKGNLILENSRIKVSLNSKNNYHINGFYDKSETLGNIIPNLLLRIDRIAEGKRVGDYEMHGHIISSSQPKIIESEDDKLTFSVLQDWPTVKVRKIVELFPGKPYFHLRFEVEVTEEFDCENIGFHVGMHNKSLSHLSYETPSGVKTVINKGEKERHKLFEIMNFLKGAWIATYNPGNKEGVSILFSSPSLWDNFPTGWLTGTADKKGGFWVSCQHSSVAGVAKPAGEKIILDAYILAFKGEPKEESTKALDEIRGVGKLVYEGNLVSCPLVSIPPLIDGKLNDTCWREASQFTGFFAHYGGLVECQTFCYIAYDNKNFYVAFECKEPQMHKLVAEHKEPYVCSDDCIEIFLDPGNTKENYFHLASNSIGTKGEESGTYFSGEARFELNVDWNPDWKVKTSLNKDYWIAEILIPFDSLGSTPEEGDIWGINLTRERKTTKNNLERLSCWSPALGGFHNPDKFGKLIFGGPGFSVKSLATGEKDKTYTLKTKISNNSSITKKIKARVTALSLQSRIPVSTSQVFSLAPSQEEEINIPYQLKKGEQQALIFSLLDADTDKAYYQINSPLLTSGGKRELSAQILAQKEDYTLWLQGNTIKIFRDDTINPSPVNKNIRIKAAKGEYEPFQIILTPKDIISPLADIRLEFSDLIGKKGKIAKENIKYNPVGYIEIKAGTDAFSRLGWWPDALLEEKTFTARTKENYPVWVTVYVPENTPAGEYKGKGKIIIKNSSSSEFNLSLTVYNFTIPLKPSIKTAIGLYDKQVKLYYGDRFNDVIRKFRENWYEHRVLPYWHSGPPIGDSDKIIEETFKKGLGGYLLYSFSSWKKVEITPEKIKKAMEYIRVKAKYAEEKGWLEDPSVVSIYGIDEIKMDNYEKTKKIYQLVKEAHPKLKVQQTTYSLMFPDPNLYGYVDIWIPMMSVYHEKRARERQALGEEVWWYTTGGIPRYPYPNLFTDHPAINPRIIYWMLWKYNIDGFYETTNINWWDGWWTKDPKGKIDMWKDHWQYKANAGHLYVYPGKDGPINSIRWELIREGIEDYDYLAILKGEVEKLEKWCRKKGITKHDDLIKENRKLLRICDTFIKSPREYTKDPQKIYSARERIGEAIDKMSRLLPQE